MDQIFGFLFVGIFILVLWLDFKMSSLKGEEVNPEWSPTLSNRDLLSVDPSSTHSNESQLESISMLKQLSLKEILSSDEVIQVSKLLSNRHPEIEGLAFEILSRRGENIPFLIEHLKARETPILALVRDKQETQKRMESFKHFFKTKNLRNLSKFSQISNPALSLVGPIGNLSPTMGRLLLDHALSRELNPGKTNQGKGDFVKEGRNDILPILEKIITDSQYEIPMRASAVMAISEIGVESGKKILLKALETEIPLIRYCAYEALGSPGSQEEIPIFLKAAQDLNPLIQSMAIDQLSKLDALQAIPIFIEFLGSSDPSLLFSARTAILQFPSQGPIKNALLENLEKTSGIRLANLFEILAEMGDRRAVSAMEKALSGDDIDAAVSAANALLSLRETKEIDKILAVSDRLEPVARSQAKTLEENFENLKMGKFLSSFLSEIPEPTMQYTAIQMIICELSKKPLEVTQGSLFSAAKSNNYYIRGVAILALGFSGNPSQIEETIVQALNDPQPYVRACAVASLFECEGNYALDRLDELLSKENSENVLFAVLTCFSKSDSQKVFAIIQKHFGSFPQKISSFAEQILARKSALGDSLESGIQTKANS